MPFLPPTINLGTELKNENPTLYNQLNDSYSITARIVNGKPNKNVTNTTPPADSAQNASWEIGDIWVDQSTDSAYMMTSRQTNTAATWTLIT